MEIKELLSTLGITGAVITGSVFVLRKFIELSFSKDLEKFKGDLANESIRFKTTYEKLHEERARVVKETFQRIVDTQRAFESLMNPFQGVEETSHEEKSKEAADQFNGLSMFFHRNEIFFDDALAKEINSFVNGLKGVWYKFVTPKSLPDGRQTRDVDSWNKAWQELQVDIPDLKAKLTEKLRSLIGVN